MAEPPRPSTIASVRPADLGTPPRTVRWRRMIVRVIAARYLFTPATILILAMILAMCGVAMFGTRSRGVITGFRQKTFSNGAGVSYARYRFDTDGQRMDDEQEIRDSTVTWRVGDDVPVRSAKILGYRYSTLADGFGGFVNGNAMALYMGVLLIVIGLPLLGAMGWWGPARQRRLLRDGAVAIAEIYDLPPGPKMYARYRFEDAAGNDLKHHVHLPPPVALAMKIGDPLTILYDPAKPSRHVVYEFCDFVIVSNDARPR